MFKPTKKALQLECLKCDNASAFKDRSDLLQISLHNTCGDLFPHLLCDFPHAKVMFEPRRPYCKPDTAETDITKKNYEGHGSLAYMSICTMYNPTHKVSSSSLFLQFKLHQLQCCSSITITWP